MVGSTISGPTTERKSNSVFILNDFNSRANLTEVLRHEDEYITSNYRDQVKGQTSFGAFIHFLKGQIGTGLLAMPLAFRNGGLLFSPIATLFMGIISTHCIHIMVKTSQSLCKQLKVPALSFAETAEKAFENGPQRLRSWSNFAKQFVDLGLMFACFSVCCVYTVFIATSFHDVINYHTGQQWNIRIYIAVTLIPCLLICQIRKLKLLVPFSALANAFVLVTFAIVLYYIFTGPLIFSDKPLIAEVKQIPLFFATVIFAMEGIGAIFPVENEMKKPQHFIGCPGVLNGVMIIVIALYVIVGTLGYVRYETEDSQVRGSITLNLPDGETLGDVAKLLMAIAILFSYGLQFYVSSEILWKKVSHKFKKKHYNISQIIIRTGCTLIIVAIAIAIPNLEPFISLAGAIFFSLLGLCVPAVCETIYLWPDQLGCCKWMLFKNIFLGIFSVLALIAGAGTSISDIIEIYKS